MRVLVLTNMWPSAQRPTRGIFVARQVGELTRAGAQLDVIQIRGDRSRWNYLRAALRIVALNVGRPRWDVVHAHTGYCGVLACLQLRYPVVLTYHGCENTDLGRGLLRMRRSVERVAFRGVSGLVAATISQGRSGRHALPPRGRARNAVIPNGVDRRLFAPVPRAEARRTLGWPADRRVVLFTGDARLPIKRIALAEAAVRTAAARVPDIELVVTNHRAPSAMPLIMSAADALILTSITEGSPTVVKEAMACDLPVVSVDVGDVAEVTRGVRHSHVCDASADALAAALVQVLAPWPQRSDGRSRSVELSGDRIARRVLAVLDRATERGPGPLGFARRAGVRPATARPTGGPAWIPRS
jgi:teichuronic acid biosynthesis glycosyltransferase TuaC